MIVLDPGHGGKDPGAVSQDGLIKEKDLTLDIAMKLKAKIESALPDSTVVLTRNKDMFLTLEDRTFVANSMKADLFLSIHCNSGCRPGCRRHRDLLPQQVGFEESLCWRQSAKTRCL